ncbi:hypothetical protein DUNSADRAFT_2587 [Dunaliella salina]|uniref:Secreted protein n=1 Tax=Dunaliella salina TaxID=3046 RepID=A0ABQ7FW44_DUNSA|nr:hypothetical protein DUNSADRAFT_2587 [Dunaliella salina]|eukprot:KAF5826594.1 hypothetical protein DUNSADRAFT_2587 [Dunaliella salina]
MLGLCHACVYPFYVFVHAVHEWFIHHTCFMFVLMDLCMSCVIVHAEHYWHTVAHDAHTTLNVRRRMNQHRREPPLRMRDDVQHFGWESFTLQVHAMHHNIRDTHTHEQLLIRQYRSTTNNGYNDIPGAPLACRYRNRRRAH